MRSLFRCMQVLIQVADSAALGPPFIRCHLFSLLLSFCGNRMRQINRSFLLAILVFAPFVGCRDTRPISERVGFPQAADVAAISIEGHKTPWLLERYGPFVVPARRHAEVLKELAPCFVADEDRKITDSDYDRCATITIQTRSGSPFVVTVWWTGVNPALCCVQDGLNYFTKDDPGKADGAINLCQALHAIWEDEHKAE